jgi:hypothetical protein
MKDAVQNLGKPLEAGLGGSLEASPRRKNTQKDMLVKLALHQLRSRSQVEGRDFNEENEASLGQVNGGRSRNRTYDLAHVRRAL